MGSAGKQLDEHAIVVAAAELAGTTCASSCSVRATSIPSPTCPGDVSMDACCTSASSELDLPILGNPEAHSSIPDASLKSSSVLQGRAAVCATTTLAPCDYPSPMESSTVHALMPGNAATHISWHPSMYHHDFTPSGSSLVHVMPPSTSDLSPMMRALEPSKHVFLQRYMRNLLPALKRIHSQGSSTSLNEKVSAVKVAADMSLAISAGVDNTWSQALVQRLASTSTGSNAPSRVSCRKNYVRKSSIFRGRFHARGGSTLSTCHRRGGSHASALRVDDSHTANVGGGRNSMLKVSSKACFYSSVRGCFCAKLPESASSACFPRSSHASCFKDAQLPWMKLTVSRSCAGQMSELRARCLTSKAKRRCQSGVSLYMKILRNSRLVGGVKTYAAAHKEVGRASSPSISKEHIESLGELVPGGRNMDVPLLLQEAAGYILSLQMQVEALESLSHLASL